MEKDSATKNQRVRQTKRDILTSLRLENRRESLMKKKSPIKKLG
jgi:hypothetical protein